MEEPAISKILVKTDRSMPSAVSCNVVKDKDLGQNGLRHITQFPHEQICDLPVSADAQSRLPSRH